MSTSELEQYIANSILVWVYSGFYSRDDANMYLDDILEDGVDEQKMRALIDSEFNKKKEDELAWPSVTDCDRLNAAFADLNRQMIIAIQNAGYSMTEGHEEVGIIHSQRPRGTFSGYCFYHGQDLERAVCGDGLMLAFGDMKDTHGGQVKIANVIMETLRRHGIDPDWSGDTQRRIAIPNIDWKRR